MKRHTMIAFSVAGLFVLAAIVANQLRVPPDWILAAAPGAAKKAAPASGKCNPRAGTGTLTVNIQNREGVTPLVVTVTGPNRFSRRVTSSQTFRNVRTGTYRAVLEGGGGRVFEARTFVDNAYFPQVSPNPACLQRSMTATISVSYALEPGSGKLWLVNAGSDVKFLFSLDLVDIPESGEVVSNNKISVNLVNTNLHSAAFDREGNLWIAASGYSSFIARYDRHTLGTGGVRVPNMVLRGDGVEDARGIAFDHDGALWTVSAYRNRIVKLEPNQFRTGAPVPRVVISGLSNPSGIAFDRDGNLWVGTGGEGSAPRTIVRYNANRLRASTDGSPDVIISVMGGPGTLRGNNNSFAFDREGNLWVGFDVSRMIVALSPDQQSRSANDLLPAVQIPVSLEDVGGLVFDNAGGLWYSQDAGRSTKRLTQEQLVTPAEPDAWARGVAPQTSISVPDLRYGGGFAVNPSPSWSPLNDR